MKREEGGEKRVRREGGGVRRQGEKKSGRRGV